MQQLMKETDGLSWMGNSDEYTWSKVNNNSGKTVVRPIPSSIVPSHFYSSSTTGYRTHDETIEILMTDLCPQAMRAFYHKDNEPSGLIGGQRVDADTGLDMLYPDAHVDSFLFEPCGYSCNGILDDGYYTIHVTPEPSCSFASFETTIPTKPVDTPGKHGKGREEAIRKLIRQVTDIFQPGSFTVTFFSSHADMEQQEDNVNKLVSTVGQFGNYKRKDKILHEFEGYDFIFGHYTKM